MPELSLRLIRALAISFALHALLLISRLELPGGGKSFKPVPTPGNQAVQARLVLPPQPPESRMPPVPETPPARPQHTQAREKTSPASAHPSGITPFSRETSVQEEQVGPDPGALRHYRLALGLSAGRFRDFPAQAREAGWEGRALLRLAISKIGRPTGVSLIGSSGHAALDQAALEMMRRAVDQTPIPERLRGQAFSTDLAVEYSLGETP